MGFKVCGPKLSLCGIIISIWGIIQLVLMGIFFHIKSVVLIEDLGLDEEEEIVSLEDFYKTVDDNYLEAAYNCWIAALIYLITLLFSGQQFWSNKRRKAKRAAANLNKTSKK